VANREARGRRPVDIPRPSVAVDTAVLTRQPGDDTLSVLQVRRPNTRGWSLPGTFLHDREPLHDAVLRSLAETAGVAGLRPRQLHVFDDPDRDDRGWVLSVAHVDVVSPDQLDERFPADTRLVPVDRPGRLPHGQADIIAAAVEEVRARYAYEPDPDGLLPEPFTLRELRAVHEAVAGEQLQRDAFRRAMQPYLVATGATSEGARGRPAELFERQPV
jgi:8-oxo-dGTP diphosphatase